MGIGDQLILLGRGDVRQAQRVGLGLDDRLSPALRSRIDDQAERRKHGEKHEQDEANP